MDILIDSIYFGTTKNISAKDLIDIAASAGADGIHWAYNEVNEKELKYLKDYALKKNIIIKSVWTLSHSIARPLKKKIFINDLNKSVLSAKLFDCNLIEIWPYKPFYTPYCLSYRVFCKNIMNILKHDNYRNLTFTIEPHIATIFKNTQKLLKTLEGFNTKQIGLTIDTFQTKLSNESVIDSINMAKEYLQLIHLQGSHRLELMSEGDTFQYDKIINSLKNINYKNDIVIQYNVERDILGSLSRVIDKLKSMIERDI